MGERWPLLGLTPTCVICGREVVIARSDTHTCVICGREVVIARSDTHLCDLWERGGHCQVLTHTCVICGQEVVIARC